MRKFLIVIIALVCIAACSKENNEGEVRIRLSNISEYDFENIVVNTSTGDVSYGSLESGEYSVYKSFDLAYRYAFIELTADGETYTLQPIDYVGETPLEKGDYTYQLDLDPQDQYTSLTLVLFEE
jgi:major membrane immunogen (membrane-anchored lipoprotein)